MYGFSTNGKYLTPNQIYLVNRMVGNNDYNYNLGFVIHDGKRTEDEKLTEGTKDMASLGSRILFKHIFNIKLGSILKLRLEHASNWGTKTNYMGSSVHKNRGIDHVGLNFILMQRF